MGGNIETCISFNIYVYNIQIGAHIETLINNIYVYNLNKNPYRNLYRFLYETYTFSSVYNLNMNPYRNL